MSEDLPTLGTPITRMLYSVLWKRGGHGQGASGYQPATPGVTGSRHGEATWPLLALLAYVWAYV